MPAQMQRPGRPTKFTRELLDEIGARLETGEPLTWICKDEHMPDARTVHRWGEDDNEVSSFIARARDIGFDAIAEDALKIADNGENDTYVDPDGNKRVDADVIQRSKLRVETRLKLLAKWCPKRYGDAPPTVNVGVGVTVQPPDALLAGLVKFLCEQQADAARARLPDATEIEARALPA